MKLRELFPEQEIAGGDTEITNIAFDLKDVKSGTLFFCLKGSKADGCEFAAKAVEKGAVAVASEREIKTGAATITVKDARIALAESCSRFYGEPCRKLKMIAVTGTNGKTTTTFIIKSILESAGFKTGLIGTDCVIIGETKERATLTTPDPTVLHRILADMVKAGMEYVVMEASAHALHLKKLCGITFAVSAFTNFTEDHLDYFGDMESYLNAKKLLFAEGQTEIGVFNMDDSTGIALARECPLETVTYGAENPSDVFAIDVKLSEGGVEYFLNALDDTAPVKFAIPGRFNMYNTLCAAAVCAALGIPVKHIARGIRNVTMIDGRFNTLSTSKGTVIIDFAHTPDGLKNLLSSVREFAQKRIITVFGCGGDRDAVKRPIMGGIVSALSDCVIITSDNPRSENPEKIIADVVDGIAGRNNYVCIPDRRQAILHALKIAEKDDIIIVAGKGAEEYQEIAGVKYDYNDYRCILRLLEENDL